MWTLSKENKAKIPEWNKRWLEDVVLRTKPMTPQDKFEVEKSIREIYRLAKLDGDNVNVVFVRSPLEATAEATAEAAKKNHTFGNANFDSYRVAFASALEVTRDASAVYPFDAASVYTLTFDAMFYAIFHASQKLISDTSHFSANVHSQDCSYLCFVRDIIGFECEEHKNYKHYETCTKQSGPRYMNPNFCVISDFPIELHNYKRDGVLVAHNDKGPSHLWSDGFAIWTIHGVPVTEQIVMSPKTLTIKQIDKEQNQEVKRVMIERFTWARYITETNAKCLDARTNDVDGTSEALMVLKDKSVRLLCACKSTARVYAIRVDNKLKNCQEAQSWMAGNKKINVIGVS